MEAVALDYNIFSPVYCFMWLGQVTLKKQCIYFASWKYHIKFHVLLVELFLSCMLACAVLLMQCPENRIAFSKFLISKCSESRPKIFVPNGTGTVTLSIGASFWVLLKSRMDSYVSRFGPMMLDGVPHTRDKKKQGRHDKRSPTLALLQLLVSFAFRVLCPTLKVLLSGSLCSALY